MTTMLPPSLTPQYAMCVASAFCPVFRKREGQALTKKKCLSEAPVAARRPAPSGKQDHLLQLEGAVQV